MVMSNMFRIINNDSLRLFRCYHRKVFELYLDDNVICQFFVSSYITFDVVFFYAVIVGARTRLIKKARICHEYSCDQFKIFFYFSELIYEKKPNNITSCFNSILIEQNKFIFLLRNSSFHTLRSLWTYYYQCSCSFVVIDDKQKNIITKYNRMFCLLFYKDLIIILEKNLLSRRVHILHCSNDLPYLCIHF